MTTMTESFDYKSEFDRVMILVQAAAELSIDIDGLLHHHSRAETLGPFLAPTEYQWHGGADNLRDQGEVLAMVAPFIRKARTLVARLKEERDGARRGNRTELRRQGRKDG